MSGTVPRDSWSYWDATNNVTGNDAEDIDDNLPTDAQTANVTQAFDHTKAGPWPGITEQGYLSGESMAQTNNTRQNRVFSNL